MNQKEYNVVLVDNNSYCEYFGLRIGGKDGENKISFTKPKVQRQYNEL